jgi:hypothetical protein
METTTQSDWTWIASLMTTLVITNLGVLWVALTYLS